MTVCQ